MLVNRKAKLNLIHTAKRQLRLSDEHYRALLFGAAGVGSAADVDHEGQFDRIMAAFRAAGFVPVAPKAGRPRTSPVRNGQPDSWWGCTPAQRGKIEHLWALVARNPSEQALKAMAARICKVDALNFLDQVLATKLLVALSRMAQTAGYNPDTGARLDTQASHE